MDYITKPMHGEEVLARVRVHLRIRETNRALVQQQRARLDQLRDAQQAILVRPEDCRRPTSRSITSRSKRPAAISTTCFPSVPASSPTLWRISAATGSSAAFLTSAVKALLRQYAGPMFSPEDTMRGVDSVMGQMLGEEQYLTACYARLNRQTRAALR